MRGEGPWTGPAIRAPRADSSGSGAAAALIPALFAARVYDHRLCDLVREILPGLMG